MNMDPVLFLSQLSGLLADEAARVPVAYVGLIRINAPISAIVFHVAKRSVLTEARA
jgi:hypothetical protein